MVYTIIYVHGGSSMPKEKQITCLADLMEYEISEFDDM